MSSCGKTYHLESEEIGNSTETLVYRWPFPWAPVADGAALSAVIRTTERLDSGLGVYLAAQGAAVRPEEPAAPVTLGSVITTETTTGLTTTVSAGSYQFARLGLACKRTSAGSFVAARVGMDLTVHQCVRLVGGRQWSLPPMLSAGSAIAEGAVEILTGFLPTAGSPKVKLALMQRALLNASDLRTQLVYRVANDRGAPGTWTALEGGWDTPSGSNDSRNSGELTPTVSGYMWVQFGLALVRWTGGSAVAGDFEASVLYIH